jgi:hypothetical protein
VYCGRLECLKAEDARGAPTLYLEGYPPFGNRKGKTDILISRSGVFGILAELKTRCNRAAYLAEMVAGLMALTAGMNGNWNITHALDTRSRENRLVQPMGLLCDGYFMQRALIRWDSMVEIVIDEAPISLTEEPTALWKMLCAIAVGHSHKMALGHDDGSDGEDDGDDEKSEDDGGDEQSEDDYGNDDAFGVGDDGSSPSKAYIRASLRHRSNGGRTYASEPVLADGGSDNYCCSPLSGGASELCEVSPVCHSRLDFWTLKLQHMVQDDPNHVRDYLRRIRADSKHQLGK